VAVNIGTPPAGKEKLTSLVKIVNQVTNAATARNVRESKAAIGPQDVFIEPALGNISFIDFKRVREAVALGEKAAREHLEALKKFSVPEAEYRAWRERTRRKPYTPYEIASIELVNPSPVASEIVMSHVKTKPGPLDMKVLEEDLSSINAIGEFDLVDYRIVPRGGGNVLQIVIKDRAWGRTSARFGLNLNSDFKGNNGFELLTSVSRTNVNRLGAEWRVVGGVGELTTLTGEYFQPLKSASPFFVSGMASWQTQTPLVPVEGLGTVGVQVKQYLWGAVAGFGDGKFWEVRGGAQLGHLWTDPTTTEALQSESVSRGAVVARLMVDSRNNVPFPSKGVALRIAMDWETPTLGADESTRRLHGIGMAAFSTGKNVFQVLAMGGSAVKSDLPYYDGFRLGGFRRLSGYRLDEFMGPNMAFGSVSYLREIKRFKTSLIGGAYYLGVSLEAGNVWKLGSDVSASDLRYAGSVFVGIDSPLGPVYVAYGQAEGGRSAVTFQVGAAF
jgi:NTE family protein